MSVKIAWCVMPEKVTSLLRRLLRMGCAVALSVALVFSTTIGFAEQVSRDPNIGVSESEEDVLGPIIPIEKQPFYSTLQRISLFWQDSIIGHVEDRSPRETLLNFYAVMASVGSEIEAIRADAIHDPGWGWSPEMKRRIRDVEVLFNTAINALNGSDFPESVRKDLVDEAAIQLKLVLDYVFSSSHRPIMIPGIDEIQAMQHHLPKKDELSWRLRGTQIVLVNHADFQGNDWHFSASTVANAAKMYAEVESDAELLGDVPFATPDFYRNFIRTPGYLVPPKWYLRLPYWLHELIEVDVFAGQTLFQLKFAFLAVFGYLFVAYVLLSRLIASHVHHERSACSQHSN